MLKAESWKINDLMKMVSIKQEEESSSLKDYFHNLCMRVHLYGL